MFQYSKSTGGFYHQDFHSVIPADAVDVGPEDHAALMRGQSEGKRISADADGRPVLTDPPPPTQEELATQVRMERAEFLKVADVAVNRLEDADQDASAWRKYRQALRDVPAQRGFPADIKWPTAPAA